VDERFIGYEAPTKEDVVAIEAYEEAKQNKKLSLTPLSELTKGTRLCQYTVLIEGNARKQFKKIPKK